MSTSPSPTPGTSRTIGAPPSRLRRTNTATRNPFWLIRGFLVIVLAIAFATLERSEMWSDKSKLVATFRMPSFLIHKVKVGEPLPTVELVMPTATDPGPHLFVTTDDLFTGKRVLLLSTPMAFSPTCSDKHIPGFLQAQDKLQARGIDTIAVVAMDTPFAMHAWSKQLAPDEAVLFLSDPQGLLAKALGATFQAGPFGLRSRRYAMILEDMRITKWEMDKGGDMKASAAASFLVDL